MKVNQGRSTRGLDILEIYRLSPVAVAWVKIARNVIEDDGDPPGL
jgi:hypothetical protein